MSLIEFKLARKAEGRGQKALMDLSLPLIPKGDPTFPGMPEPSISTEGSQGFKPPTLHL